MKLFKTVDEKLAEIGFTKVEEDKHGCIYERKKVLYEDVGFDCCYDINLYACICPSCGLHIIDFSDDDVDSKCNSDNPEDMFHSSMVHHAYIGMNNYCNRCGQKLDWGENHDR